jgi:outer membrane biosynthesis protein TonB
VTKKTIPVLGWAKLFCATGVLVGCGAAIEPKPPTNEAKTQRTEVTLPARPTATADAGRVEEPSESTPKRGHLAPALIQRVVRAAYGDLRKCYEDGLGGSPVLAGRVTVKFVIDADGHVAFARAEPSDLPDRAVVECVVDRIRKLQFPSPEGGTITVVYPLVFSPGE